MGCCRRWPHRGRLKSNQGPGPGGSWAAQRLGTWPLRVRPLRVQAIEDSGGIQVEGGEGEPLREEEGVVMGDGEPGLAQLPGAEPPVVCWPGPRPALAAGRGVGAVGGGEVADEGGAEVLPLVLLAGVGFAGHGVAARGVAGAHEDEGVGGGGVAEAQEGGDASEDVEDGVRAREIGVGHGKDAKVGEEPQDALVLLRPEA
jgi:hypothetical protein